MYMEVNQRITNNSDSSSSSLKLLNNTTGPLNTGLFPNCFVLNAL